MLNNKVASKRNPLPPHSELELVNIYLEQSRLASKEKKHDIALVLCEEAEASLSQMKKGVKATEAVQDVTDLRYSIACAFFELGRLLDGLNKQERAKESYKKAQEWGYTEVEKLSISALPSLATAVSIPTQLPFEVPGKPPFIDVNVSVVGDFFAQDKNPPVIEYKLPRPDERLVNTHQLVYCLGLLKNPPSLGDPHQDSARNWVKATQGNKDEKERLYTMTTKLDVLKGPTAIAEVACIAPFLSMEHFRCLLGHFIGSIDRSTLLDINSVDGLAKLVQDANEGYLKADDLVTILKVLNARLQTIHEQSQDFIYQFVLAVSRVLDAMADCSVKGLDRVTLHEPLSEYINNLKGLDVNEFLNGLGHIEDGLDGVITVMQTLKDGYDQVKELKESGQDLYEALKDGLHFDQKRSWYSALRGIDTVLQDGQLSKFREIVIKARCRRSLMFQWGVCQRLGALAANPAWDTESREDALEFLAEIYQNDAVWGNHIQVKQKILDILLYLQQQPQNTIQAFDSASAKKVLQRLAGDTAKQTLYNACLKQGPTSCSLEVSQPPFATLTLLDRVQDKPDAEEDLRKLRQQRLKKRGDIVYIPPKAKANLKAPDDDLFDLADKVAEFLASDTQKVLLLLGDSGSGKSTFNHEIEYNLWKDYKKTTGRIPLFINLSAIDRPEQDMIPKQLRKLELSDSQIRELKAQRQFVLICDGYDESQEKHNLYSTNRLNETGEWQAQMVVSCRGEYIGLDYRDHFQPSNDITQFQEAVIAPFSGDQVNDYLAKYVIAKAPLWTAEQYMEVLPRLVDPGNNLTTTKVTRVTLYDEFVALWLEQGKRRLGNKDLNPQARADFERLTDEGFTQNGISFLKDMASAIYKNQAGNPVVTYSRKQDQGKWKEAFFSREDENQLLLEASPLTRSGIQYRFIHKSLLEYFFARSVFEPQEGKEKSIQAAAPTRRGSVHSSFSFDDQLVPEEDDLISEPSILDFLTDRVQQEPLFEEQLLSMIEQSKSNKEARKAAANAITILVRAGKQFNGADLKGIQIPRADLSGGQFYSAQLEGADLRKTNLRNIRLNKANLSKAQMAGVQFGEWPYLQEIEEMSCCEYSPDGKSCIFGLEDGAIILYDTSTWTKTNTLQGHTEKVWSVKYSPSSHQIASSSCDKTVRLWNACTGALVFILNGHTETVCSVAYSPSGHQIATGSDDKTVRLWDAHTGAPGLVLRGHTDEIWSVAYSPSGHQIASGGGDMTVRLWDAHTGAPGLVFRGHNGGVASVAYSPSGHQIASGGVDMTVRLWDARTGTPGLVFRDHNGGVASVAYSPSGHQIASGGGDMTVRLWDARTGAPGLVLSGHTDTVWSVAYSPSGHQIASSSGDKTVRLWDAHISAPGAIVSAHTSIVLSVVYSPSGHQIASGGLDETVRLWDAHTGAPDLVLNGHTNMVFGVTYSPSGHQIASAGGDMTVRLWDARTGAPSLVLRGHTNEVWSVTYSPSGHQIASGGCDMTVRLWDASTGAPSFVLNGHISLVFSVVYSPNGRQIASSSRDETVRLWDVQNGAPGSILSGHSAQVFSVVYSPSGHQIASGGEDNTVRLWNVHTGVPGLVLCGHSGAVSSLAYSSSGHRMVPGGGDNTMRLWDVNSGQCLAVVKEFHGGVYSVAWSVALDGTYLSAGSGDMSVRIYQVMEEEDKIQICLHWTSAQDRLLVSNTSLEDVRGL
ncbi:hypothetical protein BGZ80_008932, partial [Entomortierella chlamydospora]